MGSRVIQAKNSGYQWPVAHKMDLSSTKSLKKNISSTYHRFSSVFQKKKKIQFIKYPLCRNNFQSILIQVVSQMKRNLRWWFLECKMSDSKVTSFCLKIFLNVRRPCDDYGFQKYTDCGSSLAWLLMPHLLPTRHPLFSRYGFTSK